MNSKLDSFHIFQSADIAQPFLHKCYKKQGIDNVELSYANVYRFIYFLEHGIAYYEQAKKTPLSIKPVLLFYGMVQLLKACLLTVDPLYPENTTVLAHGVSTRKRKKQSYTFLSDEVKTQKNGLFSHFSDKMFHVKHIEGTKFSMEELLLFVPELQNTFRILQQKNTFIEIGNYKSQSLIIPSTILDTYHMTKDRFISFVEANTNLRFEEDRLENQLLFRGDVHINTSFPLQIDMLTNTVLFPRNKDTFKHNMNELIVHYLILYNLSMVSRYETEWWGELMHTFHSSDRSYIIEFLTVTEHKVPYFLYSFLYDHFENK
mgnify:FL=1